MSYARSAIVIAVGSVWADGVVPYGTDHGCAGLNSCKGLGGCKVSDAKLAELAEKAGTPMDEAGSAHSCKGQNACKGLGGCSVDEARFAELKAAVDK